MGSDQRPLDRDALDAAVEVDGGIVLGEQPRHQLAAARYADLLEDRLDVVADRVRGEEQLVGDVRRPDSARDQPGDLLLARGQLVGLG